MNLEQYPDGHVELVSFHGNIQDLSLNLARGQSSKELVLGRRSHAPVAALVDVGRVLAEDDSVRASADEISYDSVATRAESGPSCVLWQHIARQGS